MKQVYVRTWSDTFTTGDSGYIYSERIAPGHVLHVHNCFAYTPEAALNDVTHIGLVNGGQKTAVRIKKYATEHLGLSALNDFFVGEGDQVYGYFPNVANNETIEIHVIGILYSLDEWRKMTE